MSLRGSCDHLAHYEVWPLKPLNFPCLWCCEHDFSKDGLPIHRRNDDFGLFICCWTECWNRSGIFTSFEVVVQGDSNHCGNMGLSFCSTGVDLISQHTASQYFSFTFLWISSAMRRKIAGEHSVNPWDWNTYLVKVTCLLETTWPTKQDQTNTKQTSLSSNKESTSYTKLPH